MGIELNDRPLIRTLLTAHFKLIRTIKGQCEFRSVVCVTWLVLEPQPKRVSITQKALLPDIYQRFALSLSAVILFSLAQPSYHALRTAPVSGQPRGVANLCYSDTSKHSPEKPLFILAINWNAKVKWVEFRFIGWTMPR
jgi:hypothetical protein